MAFDKNNTPGWMKVVIVAFAVILVVSMCLPFFSSCSFNSDNASQQAEESDQQTDSTANTTTVAAVKQKYSGIITSQEQKLADNPANTTAMASLGNNYMDMANAMRAASDYSGNEDQVEEAFATAADYYGQYLAKETSQAVSVDHAVCLFYGGKADEGLAELTAYVEGDGADYAMAWFNLGVMHYTGETPDYAAAVEAFNKAAELDSDGSAGVSMTAQIYAQLAQNALDGQSSDSDDSAEADSSSAEGTADAGSSDAEASADADAADAQEDDEKADNDASSDKAADDADAQKDADSATK